MYIDCLNVILRAVEEKDMELLHRMINAPEIECMTVGGAFPYLLIDKNGGLKIMISKKNYDA